MEQKAQFTSQAATWQADTREAVRAALDEDSHVSTLYLIALSEIMMNADSANTAAGSSAPVVVEVDPKRRETVVSDVGGGFDYEALLGAGPPAADVPIGRGLLLARSFCPGMEARHTAVGMKFTLPFP